MVLDIDTELSNVRSLKWLPWIGCQFPDLSHNKRLLIIGESHYHDNTAYSIAKHNKITYTREVIKELAINRSYYGTKIFPNLHRALFGNDSFDSKTFWNNVAYYNFVQRPMQTNKGRPSYDDFYKGWKTFFEIAVKLKPKTCLFVGTSSANSLSHALHGTNFSCDGVKWEDCISKAYAKTAIITDTNKNEIQLIFIRHTSQMFSWRKWNKYLQKKLPNELAWFEEKFKHSL